MSNPLSFILGFLLLVHIMARIDQSTSWTSDDYWTSIKRVTKFWAGVLGIALAAVLMVKGFIP